MSKIGKILCLIVIIATILIPLAQGEDVMYSIGYKAAKLAIENLSIKKGSENLLVITDAGHVLLDGKNTARAYDGVMDGSGASYGKGNLIQVNRPINSKLWFMFYNKKTKEGLYLEVRNGIAKRDIQNSTPSEMFSKAIKLKIDPNELINESEAKNWNVHFTNKTLDGNEFSIITIVTIWSEFPNDTKYLLNAIELHNHVCPGLISGYYIAKYLEVHYPLSNKTLIVWAIPPWCKDDVFQELFDATVGKRRMAVMYLQQKDKLYPKYKDLAGIYVEVSKNGYAKAIVIGFNWSKLFKDCNISSEYFKDFKSYKWWWARLKADVVMLKHNPERYVETLKIVDLGNQHSIKSMNANWVSVGENPLVKLGLMPKEEKKSPISLLPAILGLVIALAIRRII